MGVCVAVVVVVCGVAVEVTAQTVVDIDYELRLLTGGLGWMFARPEPRETFVDLVRGLLADVKRKNSWQIAEYVGHPSRHRLELLLNGAVWDADTLRDEVRSYVVSHLGDEHAAVILDDTQVVKKRGQECRGRPAAQRDDR